MNTRVVYVPFLALTFSAGLFAQATSQQVVDPASKGDVQQVQQSIDDLKTDFKKDVEDSADAGRRAANAQHEKELRAIEDAKNEIDLKNKDRDKLRREEEAKVRAAEHASIMRTIYIASAIIGMLIILGLVVLVRSKRTALPAEPRVAIDATATQLNVIPINAVREELLKKPEVLVNPDIPILKAFSERNNGIKRFPFVWSEEGFYPLNCEVELRDGQLPLAYLGEGEEVRPVKWDKRHTRARAIARREEGTTEVAS